MFKYHIENGRVLLPVDDFSKVKQTSKIIDATTAEIHLEYPNGVIADVLMTSDGADITINRELVKNADGNYELKDEVKVEV